MKSFEEDGCKYLGILEYNEVLHVEMKIRVQKEYYRRLKRILKSKLNGKNVIMAVNTWAESVLRYGAGVIKGSGSFKGTKFTTVLTEITRQLRVVYWRKFHSLETRGVQTFGSSCS